MNHFTRFPFCSHRRLGVLGIGRHTFSRSQASKQWPSYSFCIFRQGVRLNPFGVYEPTGYEVFGRELEWSTDTNNPEGFAFLFLESSYFYALFTSFGIVPDLMRAWITSHLPVALGTLMNGEALNMASCKKWLLDVLHVLK